MGQVKGTLFVDYVKMLRAKKGVDWARYLAPQDMAYLDAKISSDDWYPMAAFERMGLAILAEIAESDMGLVRQWGRIQIDWLSTLHPNLVAHGDPPESLMRFKVLRQSFFDYPALTIREVTDGEAHVTIAYGMGDRAEEAASWQTLGFFERLLEVAGAEDVKIAFTSTSWEGATETILSMHWR
ncbi:MAG TPA: hypothetical protein VGH28_26150 [Polyangiaceae bacterium]